MGHGQSGCWVKMAKHIFSCIDQPVEVAARGEGCGRGGSLQVRPFLKGLKAEAADGRNPSG